MTDTIESMPKSTSEDHQQLAAELVERARADGVEPIGPGGLLTGLTKTVLETALEAEITNHPRCDKRDPMGRNRGNPRNGTRAKTVFTVPDFDSRVRRTASSRTATAPAASPFISWAHPRNRAAGGCYGFPGGSSS